MDARYGQQTDQGDSGGRGGEPADGREAWRKARVMLQELDTKCAERALDYQALYKELEGLKSQTRAAEDERHWMREEASKAMAATNAAYDTQRRLDAELAAAEAEAVQLAQQLRLIKEHEEGEAALLETTKSLIAKHQGEEAEFQAGGDAGPRAELARMAKRAMQRGEGPGDAAAAAAGARALAAVADQAVMPAKWADEWRRGAAEAAEADEGSV